MAARTSAVMRHYAMTLRKAYIMITVGTITRQSRMPMTTVILAITTAPHTITVIVRRISLCC